MISAIEIGQSTYAEGFEPADIVLNDSTDVLSELVARITGVEPDAADRLIIALQQQGISSTTIFLDLFEPAARRLRELWLDDLCTACDITLALCRLQMLIRKLGSAFEHGASHVVKDASVLVAPQPGSQDMLASSISSEFFWQAGWDVTCAFPKTDEDLRKIVSSQWYDVVDLSLSSVFREDHRLQQIGATIRAVRKASINPQVVILASGSIFFEQPELGAMVCADASNGTASQTVQLARSLMNAKKSAQFCVAQRALFDVGQSLESKKATCDS